MIIKQKYHLIILVAIFLTSCSNHMQLGLNAYNQGKYDLAAKHWNPLAQKGNPYAQSGLGLLWENGLGSTKQNTNKAMAWYLRAAKQGHVPAMVQLAKLQKSNGFDEAAISWLNLAARWGNNNAITSLRSWGKPIPQPDLLYAKKQRDAIAQQQAAIALSNVAYNLGCALGGGSCSGSQSNYSIPSYTAPSNNTYKSNSYTSQKLSNQCSSDFSCGIGFTCVKAPYKSNGVCTKSVNKYGTRQFNTPNTDSIGVNFNAQCRFTTDCPVGFTCDSKLKACVK